MTENKTPPMSPTYHQRQSMGAAVRRRLSSVAAVLSSANGQDAVLEATRQRYEDKKRRISIVSPKVLHPEKAFSEGKTPSVPIGSQAPKTAKSPLELLSPDDATEHYRQCLRLAIENKINKKNAFDLRLIENLETLLTGKNRQNFALCASLVDVGTRIFGSRVDANDVELKRICNWLCGGAEKDENGENESPEEGKGENNENDGGEYGGNASVLMEKNETAKKSAKSHSRKAVIEEDNNKLTAPLEKRSKANPLMRGRRSALAAGGISEGLTSVLLLPSLAVTERPSTANNATATTLHYVVSETSDRYFAEWMRNVGQEPDANNTENCSKPRWSIEEIRKLDLTKDLCPPLQAVDLNKTFGNELDGINASTSNDIEDMSCEEALKSHLIADGTDQEINENKRLSGIGDMDDNMDDDNSFEVPGLEDQSIYPDVPSSQSANNQDCMLLMPMEELTAGLMLNSTSNSAPLTSSATFSLDQLHDILAKSLVNDHNGCRVGGDGVAPAWLLEQLVNGTVGKALKLRSKLPVAETKPTVKPRRNIVRVQKVAFSDELHGVAEQKLSQKYLPKSSKKQSMATITGDNDLPEPVVNHEFDEMLRKLRDCFIMGGARTAIAGDTKDNSFGRGIPSNGEAPHFGDNDDDDDMGGNEFGLDHDGFEQSFSRHQSMLIQRNFEEDGKFGEAASDFDMQNKEEIANNPIGQMLLNQVRNAPGSLASSILPRRVDVRVAKTELWRSVEKYAPATRMSVVVSSANDSMAASASNNPKNSTAPAVPSGLSPQMAFVCLLHLANEHNLVLQSGETFTDIHVQTA